MLLIHSTAVAHSIAYFTLMTFAAEEMSHAVAAIVRLEYTNVDQEMKLE